MLLNLGSGVPSSEISITSTILGFLHNFQKRDGKIVSNNITGFIKGAQQEIDRIDDILNNSNDISFNTFLQHQKKLLNKEMLYNKEYYFNNFSYSNFNTGKSVNVNKTQLINKSTPLPGIDYINTIFYEKDEIEK